MKPWLILGIASVGVIAVILLFWFLGKKNDSASPCQAKKTGGKAVGLPQVCSVWNRWLRLPEDHINNNPKRRFGGAWKQNVCPAGKYFQRFNRDDEACVSDKDEATIQLCKPQISNDDVADPVPATVAPSDARAGCDHWVSLKEEIQIENANLHGDGWDGNVCPSGAFLQHIDDECWCVLPDHLEQATAEACDRTIVN